MHINFSLPLQEPVLVFAIILFIILFTPFVAAKIKIPSVVGLILAGVIVGPHGFNLLARNSSIILFGTVGLLYIMFLAGLEIDLNEFKRNKFKSIGFGAYTFVIPMVLGTIVFYFLLHYSLKSSVLIASLFASHTLLTYPIVSKLGISKNIAVNTTVGGTMITDSAALMVLAIIAGSATGEIDTAFWIRISMSMIVFASIVLVLFPFLSRWFFKLNSDLIIQYLYVMGILFLSSFLALLAGFEAIIGAFLAGLALNKLIHHTSPLMSKIEFVGNALFIPFFLIGVGMLIDYRVLFKGLDAFIVAITMSIIAIAGKYIAAYLTQKTFRLSKDQRWLIFGLSNSQAAATLAAVLVGYNIIIGQTNTGEPIRLLDESILNGSIIMILITCTISSFATQKSAINIAKEELKNAPILQDSDNENTLIGLSNEATVESLIQLAITTLDPRKLKEFYGIHIITNDRESPECINRAHRLIEKAQKYASSANFKLTPLIRYDNNIPSGIINTIKEKNIKHFYIGLHEKTSLIDSFFGYTTKELLANNTFCIYIYRSFQPISTFRKFIVLIPQYAELEKGFFSWFDRIIQISTNTGNKFEILACRQTLEFIQKHRKLNTNVVLTQFEKFDDFDDISKKIGDDTMLIINLSQKETISHQQAMDNISLHINRYFKKTCFLLVFANSQ